MQELLAPRRLPGIVGFAQSVEEHGETAGGAGERRRHGLGGERHVAALDSDRHGHDEVFGDMVQPVAPQPVDGADRGVSAPRGVEPLSRLLASPSPRQSRADRRDPPKGAAHRVIRRSSERTVGSAGALADRPDRLEAPVGDRQVQVADDPDAPTQQRAGDRPGGSDFPSADHVRPHPLPALWSMVADGGDAFNESSSPFSPTDQAPRIDSGCPSPAVAGAPTCPV